MEAYKPFPPTLTHADGVTQAAPIRPGGRGPALVELLEDALDASGRLQREIPGWLCCRLAALYRSLGRYDDEVHLLERCRASQCSEEARTRYDARLSKAKTIAERKRRRDSGALASVRASMTRPRPRRGGERHAAAAERAALSAATLEAFSRAVATPGGPLDDVLALVCAEAHANDIAIESVIVSLKAACGNVAWSLDARLDNAMLVLLALYYSGDT